MMGAQIVMGDVFVQSVTFTENTMEIQYMETQDQGEYEQELKVRYVSLSPERPEYIQGFADLQETLLLILDAAAVYQRAPAKTLPARPRLTGGTNAQG